MWFQPIISLFTTGGKFNPVALLIFTLTAFLAYNHLQLTLEHRELVRKSEVVASDNKQKLDTIKEAKDEQSEAVEIINNGEFDNDYLRRLQQSD